MSGNSPQKQIMIDPLSVVSLFIEVRSNGCPLATGTGFVVRYNTVNYLVTNYHVLSGRDAATNTVLPGISAVPDQVFIAYHDKARLGSWRVIAENLFNGTEPRWLQQSSNVQGNMFDDVVLLPLENISDDIIIYHLDLSLANTDMIPRPAMPISIIGFPYGLTAGGVWPIWKTGHIASDPDIDYQGHSAFLIDATTRGGMSGSPVVLRLNGGYQTRNGNFMLASGFATLFLGVYSGRIHRDSEIGRVWRPRIISEILSKQQ